MNLPQAQRDRLVPIVGALFAIPFILFSMAGGYFADRYSKRSVTIGTKFFEIGVMAFFIAGLAHAQPADGMRGSVSDQHGRRALRPFEIRACCLNCCPNSAFPGATASSSSARSSPASAARSPPAFSRSATKAARPSPAFCCSACTFVGLVTSLGISQVPAADPTKKFRWNPLGDFATQMKTIRADRVLGWAVLGNTYLFFLAALLQLAIVIYGHDVLRIDDTHISYLQAAVAIGIGLGSVAAGYLSGGKIEYGLIPLGAVGMTIFGALLYFRRPPSSSRTCCRVSLPHIGAVCGKTVATRRVGSPANFRSGILGFFGGLFAVPLNALIQHRPRPEQKGGVIAAANLVSFIGIFARVGRLSHLFTNVFHQTPRAFSSTAPSSRWSPRRIRSTCCPIRWCGSCSGRRRTRSIAFAWRAAKTFPKRAARFSSRITCRSLTRSC